MENEMGLRLLIAVALIGLALLLPPLLRRFWLRRLTGVQKPAQYRLGRPAVLYFTSPGCVSCQTVQHPAVDALRARVGRAVQVLEVDVWQHPELAQAWGVFSVPAIFVLDSQGKARYVHYGVTSANKLHQELKEILV